MIGKMHGDLALDSKPRTAQTPNNKLMGDASRLAPPDPDAGKIADKLLKTLADANAVRQRNPSQNRPRHRADGLNPHGGCLLFEQSLAFFLQIADT